MILTVEWTAKQMEVIGHHDNSADKPAQPVARRADFRNYHLYPRVRDEDLAPVTGAACDKVDNACFKREGNRQPVKVFVNVFHRPYFVAEASASAISFIQGPAYRS